MVSFIYCLWSTYLPVLNSLPSDSPYHTSLSGFEGRNGCCITTSLKADTGGSRRYLSFFSLLLVDFYNAVLCIKVDVVGRHLAFALDRDGGSVGAANILFLKAQSRGFGYLDFKAI